MTAKYIHSEIVQRIQEKCHSVGLELLEIPNNIRSHTELRLLCLKHDNANVTTSVRGLLKSGKCCKICRYEQVSKNNSVSISDVYTRAISTGKFQKGTLFFDSFIKNARHHCRMYCPVCAEDRYSRAGLCEGIFEVTVNQITKGHSPCRCSGNFRWQARHRLLQIHELCTSYNEEFVCFNQPYTTGKTTITLCCQKHGVYETTVFEFCRGVKRCSLCSIGGYDRNRIGYLYVLQVKGNSEFTGYGITNNINQRLRNHKNIISKDNSFMKSAIYFEMTGESAFNLERIIKERFKRFPQDIDGFRKESTLPSLRETLIEFIHEYCEFNYVPMIVFQRNYAHTQDTASTRNNSTLDHSQD